MYKNQYPVVHPVDKKLKRTKAERQSLKYRFCQLKNEHFVVKSTNRCVNCHKVFPKPKYAWSA